MADGKVGVAQSGAPDRYIDNEVKLNDVGDTVYRQKVVDPDGVAMLNEIELLLRTMASVLGIASDPAGGRLRVVLDTTGGSQTLSSITTVGTVTTVSTVNTVTTVSTVTAVTQVTSLANQTNMGTWLTNMDVMATMNAPITQMRSNVTVS